MGFKKKMQEEKELENVCSLKILEKINQEWKSIPDSVQKYIKKQDKEILNLWV